MLYFVQTLSTLEYKAGKYSRVYILPFEPKLDKQKMDGFSEAWKDAWL